MFYTAFHVVNGTAKVIPIHGGRYAYVVEYNGAGVAYFNNGDAACLHADKLVGLL